MNSAAYWMACVEAGAELDGNALVADSQIVSSFVGNGASARLTVGDIRALLDIAEAAERLRVREIHGMIWPEDREGWCCGCGGSMLGDGGPFHDSDCPAIALDRALDALGGE